MLKVQLYISMNHLSIVAIILIITKTNDIRIIILYCIVEIFCGKKLAI